jgi:hypothetical protein
MRDYMVDLFYLVLIILGFAVCYHRSSVLSHRIDMVIMVQQSQQDSLNRCLERDSDLLFKLGRIEKNLENK